MMMAFTCGDGDQEHPLEVASEAQPRPTADNDKTTYNVMKVTQCQAMRVL